MEAIMNEESNDPENAVEANIYGLHPSLWRRLRKEIWGGDINLYCDKGLLLGQGKVFRYKPLIHTGITFSDISWTLTLQRVTPSVLGRLTGNVIPVDSHVFG